MRSKSEPASAQMTPGDSDDLPAPAAGRHPDRHSLSDILSTLQAHRPDLVQRYHVVSLGVFGSYVRGQATADSDLDILVEFSEVPNLFQVMDLEEELSHLLGVEVDLVTSGALKGRIGRRILAEAVAV